MKLLHAVIRFCATGTATGRNGVAVPQDFRVTVPAPLRPTQAVEAVHTTSPNRTPVTALMPQH